ncbi:MAG TPA: DsbA family oxidoreductase [Flavobacteriales bacterium]|nr:DsbA family oxidoreductase [Flavobacteriales bacterium]
MRQQLLSALFVGLACAATAQLKRLPDRHSPPVPTTNMTIEIWSDVVCPFCYIGKREFENALARFPHKDQVTVEWKSFELDPSAPVRSEHDMYGMLVSKYGGTRDDAKARVQGVVARAKTVGLDYQMDKAIIGSSFDAHRVIQLAKTKGKGAEAEERLFRAYFMDGAHLADHPTLVRLAKEIGLEGKEVEDMLASSRFTEQVRADEREAQQLGVRGVPFFAIDSKYAISGAQASDYFLRALEQAWKERSVVKP